MNLRKSLQTYIVFLLCLCFFAPICFAESGNYTEFFTCTAESGFSFAPYDADGVVSGTAVNTSGSDLQFGLGESYYSMSMSKGNNNGMTMESSVKSGSLQDTTAGANFTAEVSFDVSVDTAVQNPLQIRFFPQDKGGTVHKGNSIIKMALIPKSNGVRQLTVYDRTTKNVIGDVNLTDILGSHVTTDGYFFRIRYVFEPTDENGSAKRLFLRVIIE